MNSYDTDFYTWTQEQAALLLQGRWHEADLEHLIEELEAMGASERRELMNRLAVLLAHLLKWQYQPERRGRSWEITIRTQRFDAQYVLQQNPGLKPALPQQFEKAYQKGRLHAAKETGLALETFPTDCAWQFEQVMDDDFWPE